MLSSKSARPNKPSAKRSKASAAHSPEEKVAFAKAMYHGIAPGSDAAHAIARKKGGGLSEAVVAPAVEVLRRIPAEGERAERQSEETQYALQLAADIEQSIQTGDLGRFSPQAQQALLGALCRLYGANNANGNYFGAFRPQSGVTATDAMILCGGVLKAVDLQVFELGLWLSWSPNR